MAPATTDPSNPSNSPNHLTPLALRTRLVAGWAGDPRVEKITLRVGASQHAAALAASDLLYVVVARAGAREEGDKRLPKAEHIDTRVPTVRCFAEEGAARVVSARPWSRSRLALMAGGEAKRTILPVLPVADAA